MKSSTAIYEIEWEVDTNFSEEYAISIFSNFEKVGKDGSKHILSKIHYPSAKLDGVST
jgi:hypothetical protein